MKLSQKRKCGNCRAHDCHHGHCYLGFKVKYKSSFNPLMGYYIPSEPCYKPLTNNDYMTALDLKSNQPNRSGRDEMGENR